MTQATLSQNESSLLGHAISKLMPEVFSHPIWVRFGKKESSDTLKITDNLVSTVKNLQGIDPSTACQVLLICAVYQNYSGRSQIAFDTIQNALALAKRSNLVEEVLWALWGACAIRYQQGNLKQAASILEELQIELNKHDEWVLADFIDVTKRSILRPIGDGKVHPSGNYRKQSVPDLLKLTFDWLKQWGYFAQSQRTEYSAISKKTAGHAKKIKIGDWQLFSLRQWQDYWHSLVRKFNGKKNQVPQDQAVTISHNSNKDDPSEVSSTNNKPVVGKVQSFEQSATSISMVAQMLGPFTLSIQDSLVKLPASRSLSLLKYILLHHKQNIPREVLMDVFWPEAEPETARNNLNVTIYSLRRALRKVTKIPVIVYENGAYGLEANTQVWLDVEAFDRSVQAGNQFELRDQVSPALEKYETAISIYQGDFLEENPYEEWTVPDRERLRITYLDMLDRLAHLYFCEGRYAACITVCQLLLRRDSCREGSHCLLMRCYSRQGQHHLALRQYQVCLEALREELEVDPAPETTLLYDRVRRREKV